MATTFPNSVQSFPVMQDLTASDMTYVKNYQSAMLKGDFVEASTWLSRITNSSNKLVNAQYINTIVDTLKAVESFVLQKFSPAYVVSSSQPSSQETGDFWFQVVT